jgi:hypothetical protein
MFWAGVGAKRFIYGQNCTCTVAQYHTVGHCIFKQTVLALYCTTYYCKGP